MDIRLSNRFISKTNKRTSRNPSPENYSRYVFFMKILLPTIALVLVGLIFLWPQIKIKDTRFSINFKNIQNSDSEELNMINARFVGTDAKDQPFSITADMAKTVTIGENSIKLEMPKADIGVDGGTWLAVIANNGTYNQKVQTLELIGDVNLFHDSGYEFNTEKTTIDLVKGIAISNTIIRGQGPFGNLTAEGFLIGKKNNQFIFTGKSKLVVKFGVKKNLDEK